MYIYEHVCEFDENQAMTFQDIKETKRYGRMDRQTDARTHTHKHARTHGQRENSIPTTNKVCGGYNNTIYFENYNFTPLDMYNGLSQVYCIKPEGRIH